MLSIKKLIVVIYALLLSFSFLFSQTAFSVKDTLVNGNFVQIKINNKTGAIHRVYGLGNITDEKIKINEQNVENLGTQFIKKNQDILKVIPQNLRSIKIEKRKNRWHLNYRQYYKNVPVYHSYLGYTVYEDGNILSLGSDIHPDISMDVNPLITESQALQIAKKQFQELSKINTPNIRKSPELIILPVENDKGYSYYLVYNIELDYIDSTHVFSRVYFIDAKDGRVLDEFSNIRNDVMSEIKGTVKLKYYPQHYYDTPIEYCNWIGGEVKLYDEIQQLVETVTTDYFGYYEFPLVPRDYYILKSSLNSSGLSNSYISIYFSVNNLHQYNIGPVYQVIHNWNWIGDETNVYYHADWIHDFYYSSPFNYNGMNYQMTAYVHDYDPDPNDNFEPPFNGWSDGINIGFGSQSGYYWARSSDVIYHEYTHCTVYHLYGRWIGTYPYFEREGYAMDEAFADYFAVSINDDPVQGESVGVNRNLNNTKTMDDYQYTYYLGVQYDNSLIISGACWDMRENDQIGTALANELIFEALAWSPHAYNFADFLDNLLFADDDPSHGGDNNISNGSPHIDDILISFYDHKIYPSNSAVPPLTPQNFSGTWYSDHPKIYWAANIEPDFDHYEVWKKKGSASWMLKTTTTNTSYTDFSEWAYSGLPNDKLKVYYKVCAVDNTVHKSGYTSEKSFTVNAPQQSKSTIGEMTVSIDPVPLEYKIHPAFPNPFNATTILKLDLPEKTTFSLIIYDIKGLEVWALNNRHTNSYSAGYHTIIWDGTDNNGSILPTGLYLIVFNSSDYKMNQKIGFNKIGNKASEINIKNL